MILNRVVHVHLSLPKGEGRVRDEAFYRATATPYVSPLPLRGEADPRSVARAQF
ncbi:MAG: hypothetical protein QOI22_937 [Verrucomicrobiota bacterium]|jgi:hypothetical protein